MSNVWGSDRLSNMLEITQLVNGKVASNTESSRKFLIVQKVSLPLVYLFLSGMYLIIKYLLSSFYVLGTYLIKRSFWQERYKLSK